MKRPRGTEDIFGLNAETLIYIFDNLSLEAKKYGYKPFFTPIFENYEVFVRSIGESSDILSKEMYTFKDKSERTLSLRPEGTAGLIRAFVENKLYSQDNQKFFYYGPMFRYERPQKGRQRQFHQFGIELLNNDTVYSDAEVIIMAYNMLQKLGVNNIKIKINSLGTKDEKNRYIEKLKEYFLQYKDKLSKESQLRIKTNALRILDSKEDCKKDFVINAPSLFSILSQKSINRFNNLKLILKENNIPFEIDKNLVRGLDYYVHTIFEVIMENVEWTQSTLIGGGRYSGICKEFGGPDVEGVGFGIGIERLMDVVSSQECDLVDTTNDIYIASLSPEADSTSFVISNSLRKCNKKVIFIPGIYKIDKHFKRADEYKCKYFYIIGKKELKERTISIKNLITKETSVISNKYINK